jgi:hypothetical protein
MDQKDRNKDASGKKLCSKKACELFFHYHHYAAPFEQEDGWTHNYWEQNNNEIGINTDIL